MLHRILLTAVALRSATVFGAGAAAVPVAAVPPLKSPQTMAVVVRTSKIHGLVNFVETIAGVPHRSRALKETFEKSPANDPEARRLITMYQGLLSTLNANTDFPGYTSSRSRGLSVDKALLTFSAFAPHDDLSDYLAMSGSLLPPDVNARYAEVLRGLAPLYDELVWKKNERALAAMKTRLTARFRAWHIDEILTKAAKFYGSDWPEGQPFSIVLYPIPGAKGHSSAESLGSFESVGVFVDAPDAELSDRFGVMIHEICHSLYEAEPLAMQKDLDGVFAADTRPHARLAAQWINEALATALGNGWAAAVAAQKLDPLAWYNDRFIDGFAKALYPTVRSYLDQGRTIDHQFVNDAVAIFAKTFPDATRDVAGLLAETMLLTEGKAITNDALSHELRRQFRVPSLTRISPAAGLEALQALEKHPMTVLLAVTPGELNGLITLSGAVKGMDQALAALRSRNGDAVVAMLQKNGRGLFVIKVADAAKLAGALEKLVDLKLIPEAGTTIDL